MTKVTIDQGSGGGLQCAPLQAPLDPGDLGSARLTPDGPVEAGSWQTFTLVYTAGRYGIDDSGALRVCFRFAADHSKPQFTEPAGAGYTVVRASNNAVLEYRFDQKGNVRPFDQTVYVKVVNGYLKEGDTITIVFGDKSGGSPGMRVQTFVEETFEFHVLVDPVATFTFQSLPAQPEIAIVPGSPVRHLLMAPSLRRTGQDFAIGIKAEDRWGNPSDRSDRSFALKSTLPVKGLPESVTIGAGRTMLRVEGLSCAEAGTLVLSLLDESGATVASQRMVIAAEADLLPYWADFHAQSEETIGTGRVARYFDFARDEAFLDIASHQGNDFQITEDFWRTLNDETAARNTPGRFVTLPGYEWSGNTALGGDRNVFFTSEGRPIRRSSHALIPDRSDLSFDCPTAGALFEALDKAGEDAICFAHCGGRYADITIAHHPRLETAVEVHSSWGTFEWLLHDALKLGHRVGVVANSDGHKGRPGAEYPGASSFGAIGGLTCMLIPELTREAVVDGLRRRHHYGTTGGPNGRLRLDVKASLAADLCDRDPVLGPYKTAPATALMMGDIAETAADAAELAVTVEASAGIERLDIYNGLDHVETIHGYAEADLGRRIRILMEGASYRGRFRQVIWDGVAEISGASIRSAKAINFFNPDKELRLEDTARVSWKLITTGNFGGVDLWLDGSAGARLDVRTPLITLSEDIGTLAMEDRTFAVDGPLPRLIRINRLPDAALSPSMQITRSIPLVTGRDNAIYVRATLEDGTRAWSSPIYLLKH